MILIDEPTKRHMCPVTLFLSMAIADGVIDGTDRTSDIASLFRGHQHSGWLLLPYKQDVSHLPALRRTGNKSRVISSCSIKPSVLYTMMQAQLDRAGHEETFATMLRDMRNATQREKRRKTAAGHVDAETFLIGRGQAKCFSVILASEPVTPLDRTTFRTPASLKSPYPLPYVLDVQLRYDITRSMIISYLYGSYAAYHAIPDILYPFVKAAESVAYEPYYVDVSPNPAGGCPWCNTRLKR
jgi:hypothetical protein